GHGIEVLVGWLAGLGRYVVPVVLVAAGVALAKSGRSSSPIRPVVGWGLAAIAALGLLPLVRGPDGLGHERDKLGEAGGWAGALVAEPLQALLATAGAAVVLVAVAVGGALLVTQTSLRTMAQRTGQGFGSVARPLGRAARRAIA